MTPKRITIHCSATPNNEYVSIESIRKFHIEHNGWKDIGYHAIINPSGETRQGRPYTEIAAHVAKHNTDNIGICLIGTDKFTENQFDSLKKLMDELFFSYSKTLRRSEIYCHYEWDTAKEQGKTCPNINIKDLMAWYLGHDYLCIEKYLFKDKLSDTIDAIKDNFTYKRSN